MKECAGSNITDANYCDLHVMAHTACLSHWSGHWGLCAGSIELFFTGTILSAHQKVHTVLFWQRGYTLQSIAFDTILVKNPLFVSIES